VKNNTARFMAHTVYRILHCLVFVDPSVHQWLPQWPSCNCWMCHLLCSWNDTRPMFVYFELKLQPPCAKRTQNPSPRWSENLKANIPWRHPHPIKWRYGKPLFRAP